jgi:Tfp pilus assembly protein PilF
MKLKPIIFALGAALLSWDCTSTDHTKTEDLDVTAAGATTGKPAGEVGTTNANTQTSKSPAADWQSFFKGPPSAPERSQLEKKLETWKDDDKPDELLKKARAEVAIGRYGAAEASLRRAIRLSPDDLDANLELSLVYLRKRDIVRTFELLSQVKDLMASTETLKPEFVFRYRYALALSYIERGDREKGHKILSDLIGIDKGFAPAYASLASSYLEIGKDSVAEFVVRRGLDRVSDHAGLLNLMGVIMRRSKQFDTARTWFASLPHWSIAR